MQEVVHRFLKPKCCDNRFAFSPGMDIVSGNCQRLLANNIALPIHVSAQHLDPEFFVAFEMRG
jgi:hypothetical protein